MKKRRLSEKSWSLPSDILIKIAFFIPESEDLIGFLESLRPYHNLGPLECLYEWGIQYDHATLGPAMEFLEQEKVWNLKALIFMIFMYPNVTFDNLVGQKNLQWINENVNPLTRQEWIPDYPLPITESFWTAWVNMRIVSLTLRESGVQISEQACVA